MPAISARRCWRSDLLRRRRRDRARLVCRSIGVRGQAFVGVLFFWASPPLSTFAASVGEPCYGLSQVVLAVLFFGRFYRGFEWMGRAVAKFLDFANVGAEFVFGPLAKHGPSANAFGKDDAVIFAFRVLPTIIFVSAFFTVLYHLRVLQAIVWVFAKVMVFIFGRKGVSGAESLAASANVFMGQTEAPLIIKPYVATMTKSELLALMIGGMATISGGLIAVYISFGADPVAILATSVMAAPTGLYLSKLLWPETEEPVTRGKVKLAEERPHTNVIDAAAAGASEGMKLAINVAAMLIAFIAGIAMINYVLKDWPGNRFVVLIARVDLLASLFAVRLLDGRAAGGCSTGRRVARQETGAQ
jgi:CNT family concentrative nucleoside transporter